MSRYGEPRIIPSPEQLAEVIRHLKTYNDHATRTAIAYLLGMYEALEKRYWDDASPPKNE